MLTTAPKTSAAMTRAAKVRRRSPRAARTRSTAVSRASTCIGRLSRNDAGPITGSANSDVYVCYVRSDAPVKTFKDVLEKELVVGASNPGATTYDLPQLLNSVLGAKFKIVTGYPGSREITLALERGEVQGACGIGWTGIEMRDDALCLDPQLPTDVRALRLVLRYRGRTVALRIGHDAVTVKYEGGAPPMLRVGVRGTIHELQRGEERRVALTGTR